MLVILILIALLMDGAFIHWNLPTLPIAKGQRVGEIRVLDQRGVLVSAGDLVAKKDGENVYPPASRH